MSNCLKLKREKQSSNVPTYFSLICVFPNCVQEVISSTLVILAGIYLQLILRTTLSRRVLFPTIFISQMRCLESSLSLNIEERLLIPPPPPICLLQFISMFCVISLCMSQILCSVIICFSTSVLGLGPKAAEVYIVHRITDFEYRINKREMLRKQVQDIVR